LTRQTTVKVRIRVRVEVRVRVSGGYLCRGRVSPGGIAGNHYTNTPTTSTWCVNDWGVIWISWAIGWGDIDIDMLGCLERKKA